MLIWMDQSAKNEARIIAERDKNMRKNQKTKDASATMVGTFRHTISKPKVPLEQITQYEATTPLTDAQISIIGHTDPSGKVGGKTAKQMAKQLAERYRDNRDDLKEVYLIACEAGHGQKNWLGFRSDNFAQQLVNALESEGFNKVRVYAATPAEDAVATRVTIQKEGQMQGNVEAVSYLNEQTTYYHDTDVQRRAATSEEGQAVNLTKGQGGEFPTHREKFQAAFQPYTPKEEPDLTSNNTHSNYLNKLLANNGILDTIFYAIFGDKHLTTMLLNKFLSVTQRETTARNDLTTFRTDNDDLIANTGRRALRTSTLKNYTDLSENADLETRERVFETIDLTKGKYKGIKNDLTRLHVELCDIQREKQEIRGELQNVITRYLERHQSVEDKSKVNVMQSLLEYVKNPSQKNWVNVEKSTKDNPGWDKGFFSQAASLKRKVEETIDTDEEYDTKQRNRM